MNALSNAAKDAAYVLHPYSKLKVVRDERPLIVTRGDGIHIIDDNGKEYIEGIAGLSARRT
jgi:4-aminobutyrate--pyruvate transaminase